MEYMLFSFFKFEAKSFFNKAFFSFDIVPGVYYISMPGKVLDKNGIPKVLGLKSWKKCLSPLIYSFNGGPTEWDGLF